MQPPSKAVVIPTIVGVSSFTLGVGIGYVLSNRQAKVRADRTDAELADLKDAVRELQTAKAEFPEGLGDQEIEGRDSQAASGIRDDEDDAQPTLPFDEPLERLDSVRKLKPRQEQIVSIVTPDDEDVEMSALEDDPRTYRVNTFSNVEDDEWDWQREEELYRQNPKRPYVIHVEEYQDNRNDWPQETLTYYAGDMILVDEKGTPIYDQEAITGPLPFGHGSEDQNIVYIRNGKLEVEYEVQRDPGHYQYEVLGVEEIEHSRGKKKNKKPIPKFKLDY